MNHLQEKKKQIEKIQGMTFKKDSSQAVLLGTNMLLYDITDHKVRDISNYHTAMVSILEVSDSLVNENSSFCDAFWYVHVKHTDFEGIIKGTNVYKFGYTPIDTYYQHQIRKEAKKVYFRYEYDRGDGDEEPYDKAYKFQDRDCKDFKFKFGKQDTSLTWSGNNYSIFRTGFLGVNGGFLRCYPCDDDTPIHQPIVLNDSLNNKFCLVNLNKNEFYEKSLN